MKIETNGIFDTDACKDAWLAELVDAAQDVCDVFCPANEREQKAQDRLRKALAQHPSQSEVSDEN